MAHDNYATENHQFLDFISDSLPGMIAYWDKDLVCRFANRSYEDWFGKSPGAMLGQPLISLLGSELFAQNWPYIAGALDGKIQTFERELTKADGSIGHTLATYTPDFDPDGRVCGFAVLVADITTVKLAERRLMESEARYRFLAENVSDIVFHLDDSGNAKYVSPSSGRLLGYDPEQLFGSAFVALIHESDREEFAGKLTALSVAEQTHSSIECRVKRSHGDWIWVEIEMQSTHTPETGQYAGVVGAARDISLRKLAECDLRQANEDLSHLAFTDALTGVHNRRAFDEKLSWAVDQARIAVRPISLILFDVDHFKDVNDHHGHQVGDDCLHRIAQAIVSVTRRDTDFVARYGGEEFAVILQGQGDAAAWLTGGRILRKVRELGLPHPTSLRKIATISGGLATSEPAGPLLDAASLLARADKALYEAKLAGRDQIQRVASRPHDR